MTDEHVTHAGFAHHSVLDQDGEKAKATARQCEERAAVENALARLQTGVRQLQDIREQVDKLEVSSDPRVTLSSDSAYGRRHVVTLRVAKEDVIDQLRADAASVQRELTQHLETIAGHIEGK